MEHNKFLFARLTSSLSLFSILLSIHLIFTLAYFIPSESKGVMSAVYLFFFIGVALGVVLCPLFLPLPGGKSKHPAMGICFITFLIAVEFAFRSLGVRVWLGSVAIRSVMAIPEGIITVMCYGMYFLTWLRKPAVANEQGWRTGRFCLPVFGAALLVSVLSRCYSIPLIEAGLAAGDPLKGVEFTFNFTKWCILALGICSSLCIFLIYKTADVSILTGGNLPTESIFKTDWSMILRLVSLASVFTILNGAMDMRMIPVYSNEKLFNPHYLTVAAAVFILGFVAGRSISRFIRWFTPPAIVLFILVSCLPLFEDSPGINMILSTLISIAHYTIFVVFTTAVVELYSGGFWFYGIASVIFSSVVFTFLAPVISPFIPDGTKYNVLLIVIAAVAFMILAFRLIIPKQQKEPQSVKLPERQKEPFAETSTLEDIFKEYGLSQREMEVAGLLVMEGLGKKEIGERLFIAEGTAKLHISKIYQKFDVKNRAEFMALFVKWGQ